MKKTWILLAVLIFVPVLAAAGYLVWSGAQPAPAAEEAMLHDDSMDHEGQMGGMGMGMGMGQGMGQGMGMGEDGMGGPSADTSNEWTAEEIEILRSLWIGSLPPLPPDPSNQYADNPQAAALGHKLFFDTRLSSNGQVACATCHIPELMFTDGRALAVGVGVNTRKTMTIVGMSYSPWQFWDGRADSQWAQALGPMENTVEHAGTRTFYAHLIVQNYREEYEALFGPLPDLSDPERFPASAGPVDDPHARAAWESMSTEDQQAVNRIYSNVGKAIAAYERLIVPGPSRFDAYVEALLNGDQDGMQAAMTPEEVGGLRLFIGDAGCVRCHSGPLFTDHSFHNTGVPPRQGAEVDPGRLGAVELVLNDEFNCLGPYSDAAPEDCLRLADLEASPEMAGAFKPPTLRNVAQTAPYMHAGQFGDLFSVVRHYRHPPTSAIGMNELEPLPFMHNGMMQLLAFLQALSGPLAAPAELLAAP